MTQPASLLIVLAGGLLSLAASPTTAGSDAVQESAEQIDGITCATPPETPTQKRSDKKKTEKQKDKKKKTKKKGKSKKTHTQKDGETKLAPTA